MWARSLVLLIGVACASPAEAQHDPRETALARTLFEEGVAAADRGDWVGAADRFGRAYSLRPTSGLAFNWASALLETGQLLQAQELLLGVARDRSAGATLQRESAAMLEKLAPRIARLRVHVADAANEETRVEVDGSAWPRAAWDVASPIDPGKHAIVLKHGADERARAEITLAEGELRDLRLDPSMDARGEHEQGRTWARLSRSWLFWSAVGVVVAGGVVTALVLQRDDGERQARPVAGNAMPGIIQW